VTVLRLARKALTAALLTAAANLSAPAQASTLPSTSAQPAQPLAQVNAALQAGEADKALALLQSLSSSAADRAEAANLECRVRLTLEQWDAAASECDQAVRLDPQNSDYHMWLGRALGEKADRASFLSAFSLAKRVRTEFEESVRLNPRNADALNDLGEFYRQAPGIVGGGIEKAQGVAAQLDKLDPARAHELRGYIAEQQKDYDTAQRWTEMESAVHSGEAAAERDKHSGLALYDGASLLTETNRDPALAAKMLDEYLDGSGKTEEAPAFVAHIRLARLKDQLGDAAAATRERATALALAHDYKPAQVASKEASHH